MEVKDNIKINNVEYRVGKSSDYYEIIVHRPNELYGKRDEYIDNGDGSYSPKDCPNCKYDSSVFVCPTHCLTIAIVEWDKDGTIYSVKSIGTRPWDELTEQEAIDYFRLIKTLIRFSEDKSYI